jgi:hypothetical protein
MEADFDALTATLQDVAIEKAAVDHETVLVLNDAGTEIPLSLSLQGIFVAPAARGPYAIDSRSLTFPTTAASATGDDDDVFTITGAANIGGTKVDASLAAGASRFVVDDTGTFDTSQWPDQLGADLPGTFQWNRSGQEDLLVDMTLKAHSVQIYVTSVQVETTGTWGGKDGSKGEETSTDDKP